MYKDNLIVVVKVNGQILREQGDAVKLPFGSDYSILIKNLESRKADVTVDIDGNDVCGGKSIIVDGNNEIELSGFLDGQTVRNKFRFIQKTKEVIKNKGDKIDDGIIRVEWSFEKKVEEVHRIYDDDYNYWYPYRFCPRDRRNPWSTTWTGDNTSLCVTQSFGGTITSGTVTACCSNNAREINSLVEPKKDEGITVKGQETRQDFNVGFIGELEKQTRVISIRLRGETRNGKGNIKVINKPVTVKSKMKCSSCGKQWGGTFKYCPHCSTFLE